MRRSLATTILLAAALLLAAAKSPAPPPTEEPGTPVEGGCRAVGLRPGDSGPASVLLVRNDPERAMIVLPFAADWQLTCVRERRVSPGADRVISGQSDHARLFSSVIVHRESGAFDERAHLAEALTHLRAAMASQGLTVDQDAIVPMGEHLVLDYRITGRLSAGIAGIEYEVWSSRLRDDGVAIDTHLSWDASGLTLSDEDVEVGRTALRAAVDMTKVLDAPARPARGHRAAHAAADAKPSQ